MAMVLANRNRALVPFRKRNKGLKRVNKKYNPSSWTPHVSLCPDRMFVKLKYSQSFRLSSNLAAIDQQFFRGNDIEDCDASAVGAGPDAYGTSAWATFYGRCYVTSSTLRLHMTPNDNGNSKVVVYPTIFAINPSSLDNSQSHARATERQINGGEGSRTIVRKFSTRAITGERWNITQTKVLGQGVNVVSPWFWTIAMAGVPENTPPVDTAVNCTATITYNVVFYNRNQAIPTGSTAVQESQAI